MRSLARLGEGMRLRPPGPQQRPCCERAYRRPHEILCPSCTPTLCGICHGLRGYHAPSCTGGICRGCGERSAIGSKHFCEACRSQQCPECRVLGGRHGAKCRYVTRRRRPALTEYHGVVSEQDILDVYLEHGRKAVRLARSICGSLEAEDVVHDLTCYLLEKRDYLRFPPTANYFLRAAQHGALRKRLYAWARFTVAMDPGDLVLAEQAMARPGRSIEMRVRLPEPVA